MYVGDYSRVTYVGIFALNLQLLAQAALAMFANVPRDTASKDSIECHGSNHKPNQPTLGPASQNPKKRKIKKGSATRPPTSFFFNRLFCISISFTSAMALWINYVWKKSELRVRA